LSAVPIQHLRAWKETPDVNLGGQIKQIAVADDVLVLEHLATLGRCQNVSVAHEPVLITALDGSKPIQVISRPVVRDSYDTNLDIILLEDCLVLIEQGLKDSGGEQSPQGALIDIG
jgi:hypothetical protein